MAFSFYATKNLTTGEGGMVTTHRRALAEAMRMLALHGVSHDAWDRYADRGNWQYDVLAHGFKYNLSDIQAALGIHQLRKLDQFIERRAAYAAMYNEAFAGMEEVELPPDNPRCRHAWHLYILRLNLRRLKIDRGNFIRQLQQRGIGTSVHFIPIPLLRFFARLPLAQYACPRALDLYPRIVSLPLYPAMTEEQVQYVALNVKDIVQRSRRVRSVTTGAEATPRSRRIGRCWLREVLMKNHRNSEVWLERACHLMFVGLSVTAAFLLRFDFTIPPIVSPILKQAVLIAIVAKLPIFDWVGLYRSLRRFVSIPDLCLVFWPTWPARCCLRRSRCFGSGRQCRGPCW